MDAETQLKTIRERTYRISIDLEFASKVKTAAHALGEDATFGYAAVVTTCSFNSPNENAISLSCVHYFIVFRHWPKRRSIPTNL